MTNDSKPLAGAIVRLPVSPPRSAGRSPGARGVMTAVLGWLERHRQRRALEQFSDHMLKDMGVSRADVERETSKQFWRE